MPGQKVLISANLIPTSRRHTWLVSQNILKRSTVSLNFAVPDSCCLTLIAYLAAEVTRLERALTHPLDLDDEPDNNGPESDPQLSTAPAPKKKQPAKQSVRPSLTNTEGMYSQYFVSVSC